MIEIIEPVGYCFGVKNALNQVEKFFKANPHTKIYFYTMIVHDQNTNEELLKKVNGSLLKDSIASLKNSDSLLVFSAHGMIVSALNEAKENNVNYLDTTCPYLLEADRRIAKYLNEFDTVYFLGKLNHEETLSVLSKFPSLKFVDVAKLDSYSFPKNGNIAIVPQSTLGLQTIYELNKKLESHPNLHYFIDNICPHCYLRWNKARNLKIDKDALFVVCGSHLSSNAKEFFTLLKNSYPFNKVYLIDSVKEAETIKSLNAKNIYIVSATSISEENVRKIADYLSSK